MKIIQDSSSAEAVAKIRAQNESGNVTWDAVDVIISDAIRLCDEGLVREIDFDDWLKPAPDGTPATEDFGDTISKTSCFVPQLVLSTMVGYRSDVAAWQGREPKDICALFDLEAFPGRRALEKRPINNLEWALYCDGVAKDEIYDVLSTDEGVERALAKLATIKDQVIWWTAGAETPQLLADNEVVMGSTYNGRLFSAAQEQGQPIKYLWDMEAYDIGGWVVPMKPGDDKNEPAIRAFLNFITDTQRLADQASYIAYGPARASSLPLVGKHKELDIDMAKYMPNAPANATNPFSYDYEWWADHRDDIDGRFQAWLAQ